MAPARADAEEPRGAQRLHVVDDETREPAPLPAATRAPGGFADALRAYRDAAHLTQEELAERSGLSARTISDLERGVHSRARRSTLERLARALRLSRVEARRLAALGAGAPPDEAQLPATVQPRPGQLALVGRAAACEQFREIWKQVRLGGRGAVLFTGEAGIGKSRLLAELAAEAAADSAVVLAGRCDEGVSVPYRVLVDAVRPHFGEDELDELLAALGPDAAYLGLAAPELASRVAVPPADVDPKARWTQLLDAIARVLAIVGGRNPVVLIVDDLHAVDASTLGVLRYLVRLDRPERLLLVGAYRSTEVGPDHPLTQAYEDLHRHRLFSRIDLSGLDEAALGDLVEQHTGDRPEPPVLQELRRHTGGNPFFVEEILTSVSEQGLDLAGGLTRVPDGVRDVVRSRVRRLSDDARTALGAAAVAGSTFQRRVVELVAGAAALDGLDEANRAGFLQGADDHLTFRHGLVQAALLQDLTSRDTAAIHWRVGESLERTIAAADLESHLAEIAHHLARGAAAGDPAKASEYLERVGEQKFRALALDEAVDSLNSALELAPEGDAGDRRRMRILELLAETHFWRDDPDAMRAAALAAAQMARRCGSDEDLARTVVVAARWNRGGELPTEILELLDEAARRLGPRESGLLSQVYSLRAYVLQGAARGFDTHDIAQEAEAMARQSDDIDALTMALLVQTYTEAGSPQLDRYRRIVAELERCAPRVTRQDHRQQYRSFALRARGPALLAAGDRAAYEETRAELGAVAEHMRAKFVRGQLYFWDAAIALAEGRFSLADQLTGAALTTWDARPDAQRVSLIQMAASGLERGEHEQVLPEIERLVAGNETSIGYAWRAVLAAGYAAVDQWDEARRRFAPLAADGFGGLVIDHQQPHALRWLAESVALLQDRGAAQALLPRLEPYSGQLLVGPALTTIECAADRPIGQLLAVLERHDSAARHYKRGADLEEALGFTALQLRTRRWWAQLMCERDSPDDDDRARTMAREVGDAADALGMRPLARWGRALVAALT